MTRFLACAVTLAALAAGTVPAAAQGLRAPVQAQPAPRTGSAGVRNADFVVAVVNSEPVTNHEVRTRLARFEQQLQQQGVPVPERARLVQEVLERLINEKAQLQLAAQTGLKVEDAALDQAEQSIARQNRLDVPQLRQRMQAEGVDPAQFRDNLRTQLLLQRLREREVESRVRVTEADIDQHLRDLQSPANLAAQELDLAHILVALPDNPTEAQVAQAQAKAQRTLERARAGEDFGRLAAEVSDAAGAASNGGRIGVRTADRLPPLFAEAVAQVQAGGLSPLVRSPAGFHILKVIERTVAGMPPATVVQTHARHILLRPGPQQSEQQALQRLAEFKRRLDSGSADFAQLARDHSQDTSARNGGDLGWANPGLFVPEFEEALERLQPGQIADPVITRFGVHLIQLIERRQGRLTEREQREMLRSAVRDKKMEEQYVQWVQEVRGRAFVEYRDPPQ